MITVVGLGPGSPEDLTIGAREVLTGAKTVWLRTRIHPVVQELPSGPEWRDFDHYYEKSDDFAQVYDRICGELERIAKIGDVIYAVPGHPLVGEATVRRLLDLASNGGAEVRVVAGLSFIEPVCAAAGVDPLESGLQIVDALDPKLEPGRAAMCAQIYSRRIASGLKLNLLDLYPAEHEVTLVRALGGGGGAVWHGPLSDLDRDDRFDHLTTLYLPALPPDLDLRTFSGFRSIVHRLRSPGGCPWDREQTHTSLRPFLLEETYEALEKLDAGESAGLAEELGDLLLQIGLHCEIADEAGEFGYSDVFQSINQKLVRRHPHVFGETVVDGAREVGANWQRIKQQERTEETEERRSLLSGVPVAMPALSFSQAVQERAAQVGFDWPRMEEVLEKLVEEIEELRVASNAAERQEEFGDILFVLANVARWMQIDAEAALRGANAKFVRRFGRVEALARERDVDMASAGLAALDALWDEAKVEERGQNSEAV
jgi:tetrapyrrole methylase family protein / MazG family protein